MKKKITFILSDDTNKIFTIPEDNDSITLSRNIIYDIENTKIIAKRWNLRGESTDIIIESFFQDLIKSLANNVDIKNIIINIDTDVYEYTAEDFNQITYNLNYDESLVRYDLALELK